MPLIPFPDLGMCLTHVEDIAAGIILALDKGKPGEAYVLSGPVTTVREAIGVVAAETGKKAPKHAMPIGLMKALTPIGPLVGKVMGQPPNLRELISSADGVTFWATHDKATRELGYQPRGLRRASARLLAAEGKLPAGAAAHNSLPAMRVIDVEHLGRPHVIGCWEVDGMLVDPGPESSLHTVLEKIGDAAARGDPPHPHPPRPRRRHRRDGRRLARPAGLRPRARRPAHHRPLAPTGERRAPLRRQARVPLGQDPAGPGGQRHRPRRRRDGARHARRLHPRPRLPPRLLPPRGDRHRLRRRRRRLPPPRHRPGHAADPAPGHRRRALGRVDRHRRVLGAGEARPHPLRPG